MYALHIHYICNTRSLFSATPRGLCMSGGRPSAPPPPRAAHSEELLGARLPKRQTRVRVEERRACAWPLSGSPFIRDATSPQ